MINRWLLLVGALQGWALWGLWKARELKVWPSIDPVSERALLYVSLALPLAFYFTQNIAELARSRRIRMMLGIGVLFALLGAWRADPGPLKVPALLLAIALFGRTTSLVLDGWAPTAFPPMIAEGVMVLILIGGMQAFRRA